MEKRDWEERTEGNLCLDYKIVFFFQKKTLLLNTSVTAHTEIKLENIWKLSLFWLVYTETEGDLKAMKGKNLPTFL